MKTVTPSAARSAETDAALSPSPDPEAPTRGRPRAADRTPAILGAVIQLIDEDGYDRLRIQDVANRAGVGLATIYRRWPTKQDLVIEALRAKVVDLPDTGDPRADLIAIFTLMARAFDGNGAQLVPGCLAVARDEPEILQALRDNTLCGVRAHVRMLIAREVGEDDPDLDLRVDFGPGVLLQRAMLLGEPVNDPETLGRMVDLAMRPSPVAPSTDGSGPSS
jgi:AcrR family transcriptional regulator